MEARKLIKFGKNSYVVSLPKEWVTANKLKKGDDIYLKQTPATIIIGASQAPREESTTKLRCDVHPHAIETELISAYKSGVTTFIFETKENPGCAPTIKNLLSSMPGLEIVEQSRDRIVAKDLIDISQIALPTLINRMDMMVRAMLKDVLTTDLLADEEMRQRDIDLNRVHYLISRAVQRVMRNPATGHLLQVSTVEAYHLDKIGWVLEKIGDHTKRLNNDFLRCDKKSVTLLKERLREVFDCYLVAMKSYYNQDVEKAMENSAVVQRLMKEITKDLHRSSKKDVVLANENIKNILRDMRRIMRSTIEIKSHAA